MNLDLIPSKLRHFFFSALADGIIKECKQLNVDNKLGELHSVNYMVNGTTIIQRVTFEKMPNCDIEVNAEEKKRMLGILSLTEADLIKYKSIFVKLDVSTKKIYVEKTLMNGTKEQMMI
jgi:hypothetical protein